MDRRRFLAISALTPLAMYAAGPVRASAATQSFGFAAGGAGFLLDGQPFQIRSGEMHPARIPVQYWQHRIQMAKAMGLNTISIYVMWNYLEEQPGVFDLTSERRDFISFIKLCQSEGMWVLLRSGPYVCGEWDLGGLPPYLLGNNPIALRVNAASDPHYMPAVTRYINTIAPLVKPLMADNGGPILMLQIENEYGSYGSDSTYIAEIVAAWTAAGISGPFYTEDGLSEVQANHTNVSGGAIALSGGDASQIASARSSFPTVPAMAGEVYPGWLTHWGDSALAGASDISSTLTGFMSGNLSFNIYVIHGGTSFGYWAGANANDDLSGYQPTITSYDYSAPITEQGQPTAEYTTYRNLIGSYVGTLPAVPAPIPTIVRNGSQAMTPTAYASLWDNLPAALPSAQTVNPQPMETYGQNSGFMLYRRALTGYTGATLTVTSVHDYATVFLAGAYQGGISRPAVPSAYATAQKVTTGSALTLGSSTTNPTLDILVEGMGHTNFGHGLIDRKGITSQVALSNAGTLNGTLTDWQTYALPVDAAYVGALNTAISDPTRPGIFFRATVTLTQTGDTYIDMSGWTKGLVWVNGNNLGRYWSIGPQQRLYCPAGWLNAGTNEILILDLHRTTPQPFTFEAALTGGDTVVSGGIYEIMQGGQAIDDPAHSTTAGTQLIVYALNGGTNQQWQFTANADGTYYIQNVGSKLYIDDSGASDSAGSPIIQWTFNGNANQSWNIVPDGTAFNLVSKQSGLAITASGTANLSTLTQQANTHTALQQWTFTKVG